MSAVRTSTQSRRTRRRADLLDAADRAVRGLGPAATMDDMAAEAGVSKVILYRYFGDKEGLYRALVGRYLDELLPELRAALTRPSGRAERLQATISAYVGFIDTHREAYDFLMRRAVREGSQETVDDFMRGVAREVADVIGSEIRGLGLDPLPAQPWGHGLVGMVHQAADWWLDHPEVPRDALVAMLVALLWRGFEGLASDAAGEPATRR